MKTEEDGVRVRLPFGVVVARAEDVQRLLEVHCQPMAYEGPRHNALQHAHVQQRWCGVRRLNKSPADERAEWNRRHRDRPRKKAVN